MLEVDRDRALVAIDQREHRRQTIARSTQIADAIAPAWWLDLDDIRALIGKHDGRHGAGDHRRQVEHANAREWADLGGCGCHMGAA